MSRIAEKRAGARPGERRMTKAAQSEATRRVLLKVARELFARRGYAGVSTEEIVKKAGVTRGALYHHFGGKQDLFRAVFEQLEQEVAEKIAGTALAQEDPWEQQLAAMGAFLDACLEPAVQRIALVDAPSVLGLAAWREIEETYGLALVRMGLQSVMEAGLIEEQPLEPLAHLVLGAMTEAGLLIARAEDRKAARAEVGQSVERLLAGLRVH
jgi:AcrR family transcriptional regulator